MLTERQINIIVFLINADDWVTSDRLSTCFNLNRKTIQTEIREITNILKSNLIITVNKHKGYQIDHITEEGLKELMKELNRHEVRNCLPPRQSTFILYLLFLKSYITMQNLADIFFMSKTAVSLEISAIKRWIERYDGLSLEISNKNGIMIHGSEEKKRIYCSKHGTLRAFKSLPFPDEVKKKYEEYIHVIKEVLSEACIRFNEIQTGEELQKITQYLASSIIRSCMGYLRRGNENVKNVSSFLYAIKEGIVKGLNYELTEVELYDLQIIWNESNTLKQEICENNEMKEMIYSFMQRIYNVIGISPEDRNYDSTILRGYIEKMKLRYESGDIAINHYNEDIVLRYPLEAYLVYRYFTEYFLLKVTKETSFIALFLSTCLYRSKQTCSILLVSDQNISVIQSIQNIIEHSTGSFNGNTFKAIPVYQYQNDPNVCFSYDILLTTDQKTVLTNHSFFLISPIISKEDILFLQQYIQKHIQNMENEKKKDITNCYVKEFTISRKEENYTNVNDIIGQKASCNLSYHTYANDKLYIGEIGREISTSINIYHLEEPISFKYKKIKRIIYAGFHEGDNDIFLFFDTVSDILNRYK